jgi:GTP cyclohydrolase I
MKDVQNSLDLRNIPLEKVGVKNVRYPILVRDKANETQSTHAIINLYADLPHHFKGTHMSRFIEVLQRHHRHISVRDFLAMLDEIRTVLNAQTAFGEFRFAYFINKKAPKSQQESFLDYQVSFSGEVAETHRRFFVEVQVPVMTLCPCSKEISKHGAHNQRGFVRVKVLCGLRFFWLEDLITVIESCASSGVFTLLKREDEKYITEHSYENPVFVEDLVREVTIHVESWQQFPWFRVEAENMESIHNHEAYACVERGEIK